MTILYASLVLLVAMLVTTIKSLYVLTFNYSFCNLKLTHMFIHNKSYLVTCQLCTPNCRVKSHQ